jgi:hypothetical protein
LRGKLKGEMYLSGLATSAAVDTAIRRGCTCHSRGKMKNILRLWV